MKEIEFKLDLNEKPFNAIKAGIKKVEGRTPKDESDKRYDEMKEGDSIVFTNNVSFEKMSCKVLYVRKYKDVRTMLEAEGIKNVLSSEGDIEQGIESYHNIADYKERISKFGIYAIGVEKI